MKSDRDSFSDLQDQKNVKILRSRNIPPPLTKVKNTANDSDLWNRLTRLPSLGVILGLLSSFSFSVAIMLVKIIKGVDPMFFVMCRGILQLFLFNAVFFYQGLTLEPIKSNLALLYLFLTGVLGSIAQVLAYGSLAFIPLGDATAILLSAPVFVSFFACVLLKEKCGAFQVLTVVIAVTGVALVCRPTFIFGSESDVEVSTTDHLIGTSMVAAGCISLAGVYVALRKISHVPMAITNASLGMTSMTFGICIMIIKGNWHIPLCGVESLLLVISACAGTLGMLLFVCATRVEEAGPLSVVRTSEIIFAFFWQMGLLGHTPSWTTLAGAGAIVSSVVLTGMHKWTAKYVICTQCCQFDSGAPNKKSATKSEQIPMNTTLPMTEEHC